LLFTNILITAQTHGFASYYGNKLHRSGTSDGGRYHKDSMTCAHRTLPFGTWLKVKNLRNNKEVIVKVTDRGPHVKGRIIDLSYVAAKQLDFIAQGVTKVEITNLGMDRKLAFEIANDSIKMDSLKMINTMNLDSVRIVNNTKSAKPDSVH
jgi:rare lipoprotein A